MLQNIQVSFGSTDILTSQIVGHNLAVTDSEAANNETAVYIHTALQHMLYNYYNVRI